MDMTAEQLSARTNALLRALPLAGFTRATLDELATIARAKLPLKACSAPLRIALLTLVKQYHDQIGELELADAVAFVAASSEALAAAELLAAGNEPPEKTPDKTGEKKEGEQEKDQNPADGTNQDDVTETTEEKEIPPSVPA